jgi:uncharacterized protein YfaS (alpha-2-macroglobulin family)
LLQYPYGCIEQTTSSTRPLLYAQNVIGGVDSALLQKGAGVLEEMVAAE